jgi:hypothetical protein
MNLADLRRPCFQIDHQFLHMLSASCNNKFTCETNETAQVTPECESESKMLRRFDERQILYASHGLWDFIVRLTTFWYYLQ